MADPISTPSSTFSRTILPGVLFAFPADQDSMLLAGRYAKPFVQHTWREFCKRTGIDPSPAQDSLKTETKFLGNRLGSVIVHFAPPEQVGEAYLALFIVPARPDDGPRRYFTIDLAEGASTVLYEWIAEKGNSGYRAVVHARGIAADPESLGAAVERLTVLATPEEADLVSTARTTPLFTRYVVSRGNTAVAEAIARESILERGLQSCSSMLLGIRASAADVVRANPHTGEVQSVAFGIPGDLFSQLPPALEAIHRRWPGHLFTVSSEGKPLMLNLLIPGGGSGEAFAAALSVLIVISGEPDPTAGDPSQRQRQTLQEIMAHRPALVSVLARWPGDEDKLADLLGFTQHFGAAVLLEEKQPESEAPKSDWLAKGGVTGWLGKLFGKGDSGK